MADNIVVLQQYITLTKDIISILSTITVAIVAVYGLKTWRRQADFETGRRLLRSVYRLRDAIQGVRNPYASANEISAALKEAEVNISSSAPDYHQRSQYALYGSRWKWVQDCLPELQVNAFEAEVTWGRAVRDKVSLLIQCKNQLYVHLDMYLRSVEKQGYVDRTPPELHRKTEEAIFDTGQLTGEDSNNWLTKNLNQAIEEIEGFVKHKMQW